MQSHIDRRRIKSLCPDVVRMAHTRPFSAWAARDAGAQIALENRFRTPPPRAANRFARKSVKWIFDDRRRGKCMASVGQGIGIESVAVTISACSTATYWKVSTVNILVHIRWTGSQPIKSFWIGNLTNWMWIKTIRFTSLSCVKCDDWCARQVFSDIDCSWNAFKRSFAFFFHFYFLISWAKRVQAVKPKRCARLFGKQLSCDSDFNEKLSRTEWTNCLTKERFIGKSLGIVCFHAQWAKCLRIFSSSPR